MKQDDLTIGQFALASGLSLKALRIYHEQGLLEPAYIDPSSGYRYYRADQLQAARLIRTMRDMEMPLKLVRKVLKHMDEDPEQAQETVHAYLRSLEARLSEVQHIGQTLISQLRHEEYDMITEVELRKIDPQWVASVAGNVKIEGLLPFIGGNIETIRAYIEQQHGQVTGVPFGIYHGPVNERDDGPIEVCWPIAEPIEAGEEIQVRQLPGGQAAAVTLTDDDCDFPDILKGYDAVAEWVQQNGHELVGSPREIWLSEPDAPCVIDVVWLYK